jgi:aerobic-type carbon monoxide dehydrogenase small subunit (CoxS/CutS family)
MAITLTVNGETRSVDVEPDTPLLWVLRDTLGLTGTKFGCGIAACGACTVHLDGRAVRTCTLPVSAAAGMPITTIEGLEQDGDLNAVQQAWVDHQVPQCGYCQSGMIMAVSSLLAQRPDPSDAQIDATITNICRCGTFVRVRRAIHAIAEGKKADGTKEERHG